MKKSELKKMIREEILREKAPKWDTDVRSGVFDRKPQHAKQLEALQKKLTSAWNIMAKLDRDTSVKAGHRKLLTKAVRGLVDVRSTVREIGNKIR